MTGQGTRALQPAFPSTTYISRSSPAPCSTAQAGKKYEIVLLERPRQIQKHCVQPVIVAKKKALLRVLLFA